jgi:hypothetical protein
VRGPGSWREARSEEGGDARTTAIYNGLWLWAGGWWLSGCSGWWLVVWQWYGARASSFYQVQREAPAEAALKQR